MPVEQLVSDPGLFGWKNAVFWPQTGSTFAGPLDAVGLYLLVVSVFFTTVITVLLIYFALKYRRRPGNEIARELPLNYKLETAWTIVPFVIVLVAFFWGGREYLTLLTPPSNAEPIYIVGKQWMWHVQHRNGIREINELHVPVGRKIQIVMISEDVIHSFYIPAFRMKFDTLPGRYTRAWFQAKETGRFHLLCAEYCGADHSMMIGKINVLSESAYREWEDGQKRAVPQADLPQERGARIFANHGCKSCHSGAATSASASSGPTAALGPGLHGLFGSLVPLADGSSANIADENYIRESILSPQSKIASGYRNTMPIYAGLLTETEILDLIAYIRSMKK